MKAEGTAKDRCWMLGAERDMGLGTQDSGLSDPGQPVSPQNEYSALSVYHNVTWERTCNAS